MAWFKIVLEALYSLRKPLVWVVSLVGSLFSRTPKADPTEEQAQEREKADQAKLNEVFPQLSNLLITLRQNGLGTIDGESPHVEITVALLAAAQPIVNEFAGGALLSIKLVPELGSKNFVCVYPPLHIVPRQFRALIRNIPEISYENSYAGVAHDRDRTIFESDLANPVHDVKLDHNVMQRLKDEKIGGLVVHPIALQPSPDATDIPAAVLKIDFLEPDALTDNAATQTLLTVLADFFSFAMQLAFVRAFENGVSHTDSDNGEAKNGESKNGPALQQAEKPNRAK